MTRPRSDPHRLAIALTSALILLAPTGVAYHLSAGAEDTVGLSQSEPPADTDSALYERGTSLDCSNASLEDPATLTRDAFCGELVYNEGTKYETISPEDQLANGDVSIDLQMASYVGLYGTTSCSPWCNSPEAYDGLHDAGAAAGLLPPSDDVEDNGTQAYGGNVYAVSPMHVYQAAGQGWLLPVTDTSFVAFVTDEEGRAVDEAGLAETVEDAKEDNLDESAQPAVCAFTPEAHLGTHAPDSGRCEVELDWMGHEAEGGQDACEADTYVCGSLQPAWRATTTCPMWHAACYLSDAWNSAHHFAVWHGVVAPSPPDGCRAAEPGFDTAPHTFLAHDLDVYTPPSDETPAQGIPAAWDEASRNVPGADELRGGQAPDLADTPAGQQIAQTPAFAQHEAEPNTDGWMGIEESSREISQTRTINDCQTLATGEQENDPWVNIVDAHVTRDETGLGVVLGAEGEPDHEPKPSMRVTGNVGFFADVDDDGDHEPGPSSGVFDVEENGAYPILWDHHEEGEGCEFRAGTTMGDLTSEAGYTDPTGLVVTLRLSDGALVDTRNGESVPVLAPTAVVMLSAGLDAGDETVEDVIEQAAGERPTMVLEDAFQPQCGEPTGGFTSAWEILGQPMAGDGLATAVVFTLTEPGPGDEGAAVPPSPVELGATTHVWWDVDPFADPLAG